MLFDLFCLGHFLLGSRRHVIGIEGLNPDSTLLILFRIPVHDLRGSADRATRSDFRDLFQREHALDACAWLFCGRHALFVMPRVFPDMSVPLRPGPRPE